MSRLKWTANHHGVWTATFGRFTMRVYQHRVDGHRWSAVVFDEPLPELHHTKESAMEAAASYAWLQLGRAADALGRRDG